MASPAARALPATGRRGMRKVSLPMPKDPVIHDWGSALGFLGRVFDQDAFNMPKVQLGLESTYKPGVTLASYQESKVRWLHHKLGEWVEGSR